MGRNVGALTCNLSKLSKPVRRIGVGGIYLAPKILGHFLQRALGAVMISSKLIIVNHSGCNRE